MADTLLVSELFYSIQGESTRGGQPCLFIRLHGCDQYCRYCDSRYTWEETPSSMTINDIVKWTRRWPKTMVEITGGEPLLQSATRELMKQLLETNREVLLETSGSRDIGQVPTNIGVIMDIKTPDSRAATPFKGINLRHLDRRKNMGSRDEIKFVLASEEDFHWAADMIRRHNLTELCPVLFSPVIENLTPARLAELLLATRLPVRLQLQLHRILWPERHRGV